MIRVRKKVKRYVDTDRFGMIEFTLEDRKNALQCLTTSILDRSAYALKVVKQSFYCVALSK